jgi:ATP-dependent helicase/nuclease subunit B
MNKHIITTVITQKHAQKAVIKHFLNENPVLFGTEFLSWDNFVKLDQVLPSSLEYYWKCVDTILQNKDQFPILNKSLNYPSAVDECIAFMDTMAEENMGLSDLPDTSKKDKELKQLLTLLNPDQHPKAISYTQFKHKQFNHSIKIIPSFQSYASQRQINHLIDKGAEAYPIPRTSTQFEAYYAKNPRMEAYGIVQKIAQSKVPFDKTIIVCLDPETIEPLTQYLAQLNIPYTYQKNKNLMEARQFVDCLNFIQDPTMDALLKVIKSGFIKSPHTLQLLQYIEIAAPTLSDFNQSFTHLKDTLYENDIWDKRSIKHLLEIERKSEELRPYYLSLINFESTASLQDNLKQLFILFSSQSKNYSALSQIRECLQTSLDSLSDANYLPYLIHQLEQLSESETREQGIQIVSLTDAMIPFMDQMFVLGCSSKNYPQYPTQSGFFDETYFNQCISDSKSERYLWHMTQLETIFTLSKYTCFSYSVGNYEGKGASLSFEIEDFLKRHHGPSFTPLPLIEAEVKHEREFKLDPTIAKQLFFKHDGLYGSVSSFESFFRCPYQYYLKSGLKLYIQKPFTIDNSLMGTISHAVFEQSVKKANKDYPNFGIRHLDDILDPMFNDLKNLYPKQVYRINSIQTRAKHTILESLNFFKKLEENTDYSPYQVEVEFNQSIEIEQSKHVHLKGFIDRVDARDTYFRIIDYKSSAKSLTEKSVLSGNKLQLPTYALFGKELFDKIASGIYYASFGQTSSIPIEPFTYAKTKGITELSKDDYEQDYLKERKWEGYTLDDESNQDKTASYIKGLKLKNGTVTRNKQYSIDLLNQALRDLYTLLYHSLEEGFIEKDVVKDGCTYCDYKAICQFRGEEKDERNRTSIKSLVEGGSDETES